MQGLLGDYLSEDPNKREAQRAGLLNFGAQLLMNSNRGFAPALGTGLIGGTNAYQGTIQDQQRQAVQAATANRQALEGRVLQQQLDQPAQISAIINGGQQAPVAGLPEQQTFAGDGGQSVIRQPQADQMPVAPVRAAPVQPQTVYQRYMEIGDRLAANGFAEQAQKYYDLGTKLAPKLKNQTQLRNAAGNVITANVYEDGRTEELSGFTPAEKLTFQNTGGSTVALDPFTGKPVNTIRNTQSPDSIASNAVSRENSIRSANAAPKGTYDADRGILVDTRTGLSRPVTNADGSPISVTGKPLTEFQGKSANFGARMAKSNVLLNDLIDSGVTNSGLTKRIAEGTGNILGLGTESLGGALSQLGGSATNWTQSADQQKVEQAKNDFLTAALRLESGAVIGPKEIDTGNRQYFPQAGDSPEVIKQKALNRQQAIEGTMNQAGPGGQRIIEKASEKPVKAPPVGTVKNGYEFKGGNPAEKNNWVKK